MKKVYIATLGRGLGGPIKVMAEGKDEAKKAAYSAYTFQSAMWHPNPKLDDVVKSVELDPDQRMDAVWMQPAVTVEDYKAPSAGQVWREQFAETGKES